MNCLFQLRRSKQLTKRRLRERPISRELQRERIDLAAQRSHAGQWIFRPSYFLSEHDLGRPVCGEVASIDTEGAVLRSSVRVIQSEIARDKVGTAVMVEVSDGKAVPPTTKRRQPRRLRYVAQSFSIVAEKLHRH